MRSSCSATSSTPTSFRPTSSAASSGGGTTGTAYRPPDEVVSFAEDERLYRHSWGDPEIRWLMSTVATAMIFDDHDIRDDWNTSAPWRTKMAKLPWWRDRIRAGLASVPVYQHLGNLSPAELADNEDYQRLLVTEGDTWPHLAELADRADREVDSNKGIRFSYQWDLGRSRLIMIDSRNGRILESGERHDDRRERVPLVGGQGRRAAGIDSTI